MTYFIVACVITGLLAHWLTRNLLRGANSSAQRFWFFVVWVIGMILAYIPAR